MRLDSTTGLYLPATSRRAVIRTITAGLAAVPLAQAWEMDLVPTHPVSEGPAYKPGAPFRSEIIAPGTPGQRFLLEGMVVSIAGKPIREAIVDLWNVQNNGKYDFDGFNLRGRQLTSKEGRYRFLTIEAIPYGSRTAHFHFKVSAPGYEPLTTELYLAGLPTNARDSMFSPSNAISPVMEAGIRRAGFEFVLKST